jgi:ribosomal-protein-alanine N-acetyltransferase
MEHLGTKIMETERLILRPFTINDAQAMYKNWASDDEVTKFLTWETHKDIETTKAVLESFIPDYDKDNFYHWAVVLKEIDEPIGSFDVVKLNDKVKMVHIGFCIGKKWWNKRYNTAGQALHPAPAAPSAAKLRGIIPFGSSLVRSCPCKHGRDLTPFVNKGIATEALTELILFFFEGVLVNRVESRHAPNNPNSGKVLIKCGMKYEGTKRQADINNQGICDSLEYGIIAEDYFRKIKEEIKNKIEKSIIDGTKEFEQFLEIAKRGE